jgi:putative oxidoreductase
MIPDANRKDLGILALRVLIPGTLFFGHGLSKFARIPEIFSTFADPIGLGPALSATLVLIAEGPCAILAMMGIRTRIMVLPIIIMMVVAFAIHHADDPFRTKERALLYLIVHLALFITGGGRYVLDRRFLGRNS